MDLHWFSYGAHDGPGNSYRGNGCMISIVLDGSACYNFSAIRLLLVYKASESLRTVRITTCPRPHLSSPRWPDLFPTSRPGPLYNFRTLLGSSFIKTQFNSNFTPESQPLPICTVVLELIEGPEEETSTTGYAFGELSHSEGKSVSLILVPRLDISQEGFFQVAYDFTKRCDPTDPSMLVFLDSTHHRLGNNTLDYPSYIIPAHYIRVLPLSGRSYSVPPLPALIIRRIADLAVGSKLTKWRKELLFYGLVCKAWVHILDLFFERMDGEPDADGVDARVVARCIEAKPERGRLITSLPLGVDWPEGDRPLKGKLIAEWNVLLAILRHARSLEMVDLCSIPRTLAPALVSLLTGLRHVKRFTLLEPGFTRQKHVLGIADILTMIADWGSLYKADIREWAPTSIRHIASPLPPIKCNIHNLKLRNGIISGTQLMQFAQSPVPRLQWVRLQYLEGLTNSDLYAFFSVAGSNLTHLMITGCTVPRSSANEELAMDAVMPLMTKLESLSLDGDLVTARAIAGRTSESPATGLGVGFDIMDASKEMTLKEVREALEVTGWRVINIQWWDAPKDTATLGKTVRAAKEKGIEVDLRW